MLFAQAMTPRSIGNILLDSENFRIGQAYGLRYNTEQLNLNSCAEV